MVTSEHKLSVFGAVSVDVVDAQCSDVSVWRVVLVIWVGTCWLCTSAIVTQNFNFECEDFYPVLFGDLGFIPLPPAFTGFTRYLSFQV